MTNAFTVQGNDLVLEVTEHALDLVVAAFMQGEQGAVAVDNHQLGGQGGQVFVGKVQPRAKASMYCASIGCSVSTR